MLLPKMLVAQTVEHSQACWLTTEDIKIHAEKYIVNIVVVILLIGNRPEQPRLFFKQGYD